MQKFKQFDLLEIMEFEQEEFGYPRHGQNYYEIMYILKGRGEHQQNRLKVPYAEGDIFVISPSDEHDFVVQERTLFFAIKFTDGYLERFATEHATRYLAVKKVLSSAALHEQVLHWSAVEKSLLAAAVQNIKAYQPREQVSSSIFIYHQLMAIVALLYEGLNRTAARSDLRDREDLLLSFIHQHIYDPAKLQIAFLAAKFHISPSYFGKFFKRTYGMSLREYVKRYKFELVKKRLDSGDYTLKQIAEEFGFTDESHVHKFYYGNLGAGKF